MQSSAVEFSQDPFSVRFRACHSEPENWKDEVMRAAFSIIGQAGNRPIVVCFSGGLDSEIVCRALFEQGVNFSALTVSDSNGYNRNDVSYATKWCKDHAIAQKVIQLDLEDFYATGIERYVREGFLSVNLFRYFQLFLFEQVQAMGGFAVIGGGEPHIDVVENGEEMAPHLLFSSGVMASFIWMAKNNVTHQPFFYFSTPELVLTYLRTSLVGAVLREPVMLRHKGNQHMLRRFLQFGYWPQSQIGHESGGLNRLDTFRREKEKELNSRFKGRIDILQIPITQILEQLEVGLKR